MNHRKLIAMDNRLDKGAPVKGCVFQLHGKPGCATGIARDAALHPPRTNRQHLAVRRGKMTFFRLFGKHDTKGAASSASQYRIIQDCRSLIA